MMENWRKQAKIGHFLRMKRLIYGLYVFSIWKYSAFSTENKKILRGKQSSLLNYFQKMQIFKVFCDFAGNRKRIRNIKDKIAKKRAKLTFSAVYKTYLVLKEKRLATELLREKRKLFLSQESERLKVATDYHRHRVLLRSWKSLRIATTRSRSRSVSKELSMLSDISMGTPSRTEQSRSMMSISKRSPIPRKWITEEHDLTPSKERHERVTAIISRTALSTPSDKVKEQDLSVDDVRKQLTLNLEETEPALLKAQSFLTQLNELLASTKKSSTQQDIQRL